MHTETRSSTCISHYPTEGAEDALALTGSLTEIRTRQAGNRALARLSQERRWLTRTDDETLHRLRSVAEDGHSWGVMFHVV